MAIQAAAAQGPLFMNAFYLTEGGHFRTLGVPVENDPKSADQRTPIVCRMSTQPPPSALGLHGTQGTHYRHSHRSQRRRKPADKPHGQGPHHTQ